MKLVSDLFRKFGVCFGLFDITGFAHLHIQSTCIKRSPLGQRKSDLIRQVTS